jgi:hypothetical protein
LQKDFTGKKPANEDDQKLLFGMLFSLKRFIERTSPLADDDGSFHHYTTSTYKLHQYYTSTGMRFVALSDPKVWRKKKIEMVYIVLYVEVNTRCD